MSQKSVQHLCFLIVVTCYLKKIRDLLSVYPPHKIGAYSARSVIVFIVLTVTVIIPMIGDIIASTDKNHSITELQAVAKEYYKDVINMELIIEASVKDNTVLKIPEDLNTRQSIEEKGIKNRADVSKRIEEFIEKHNWGVKEQIHTKCNKCGKEVAESYSIDPASFFSSNNN